MVEPKVRASTIWSIQYLRATAAIAVVVFHQLQGMHWIFSLGLHGVDMFFVISGFIMFVLTDGRNITPAGFALDRIARIVPPYWLATLLTLAATFAGAELYHSSTDFILLARSLIFIPTLNEFEVVQPTLYLGWTLNFEIFFYAIFAGILFLQRGRLVALSIVLILLVVGGAAIRPGSAIAMTYTSPLLLEFLSGALLGALFGGSLERFGTAVQGIASLLLAIALGILSFSCPSLAFGAVSVVILAAGLLLERAGLMPHNRLIRHLGDASFAIYLFQQFAFAAALAVSNAVGGLPRGLSPVTSIVGAIGLGVLVLRFVERPLTRQTRAVLRRWTGERVGLTLAKA